MNAAIFGSYAKNEAQPDSDIDLLVYLDDSFELDKYLKFEASVKRVLNKEVDIVEYRSINEFMRDDILKEAVLLYECERQEATSYNNRGLINISEAVTELSTDFTDANNIVNWKQFKKLRNIAAHKYGAVNFVVVWNIIKNNIPDFKDSILKLIN